ncbi:MULTISPECIES: DUF2207 family protein [Actinoalloteichus]|uniref:Membrane protein (DUF2207) n=1 Tax=Actinoalloteichus fjordicus TaxID=1612552 RepID=A0AAC9PQF9_9PSEU|nr:MULTISPECIES: DUF2207 domain-containing protein [Actinoalloteichus]APU13040.1 putative membrane protein (DUF2207) [Actinoalloteichus fjordicus]APU19013.1 putative membrane protein (DUF2207) [Actinoalloteichus sp. GBA129-24]
MTVVTLLAAGSPAAAQESDQPTADGSSVVVELRLEPDGTLSVEEQITVLGEEAIRRESPLRELAGVDVDRVYEVRDVETDGPVEAEVTGRAFIVTANQGTSTLRYQVDGAVADLAASQEFRWQVTGDWDADLSLIRVAFVSPSAPQSITCLAGAPSSNTTCTVSQIDAGQLATAQQTGLDAGDRLAVSVGLPADAVPATARYDENFSIARAFSLTPSTAVVLGVLFLLLLVALAVPARRRRQDRAALRSEIGPVDVLLTEPDGSVAFASPDGVLPGQVGTVVDEHVDVVDITSTIVDLAVRNYLWIEELHVDQDVLDWRIVRRNPPDEALHDYERVLYACLLGPDTGPDRREEVLVSELSGDDALDLAAVQNALYADVVERRWFSVRPDQARNRWWWAGLGVTSLGAVLTVLFAALGGSALIGLGLVVIGLVMALDARRLPARTVRGSRLVAQVRGLRDYLDTASCIDIPADDREMVFSRSLPYAVVLGETRRWMGEFAGIDGGADGTPGLYWYGEDRGGTASASPDLRRFAVHFPSFLAELDGVLAEAGHLRSLR